MCYITILYFWPCWNRAPNMCDFLQEKIACLCNIGFFNVLNSYCYFDFCFINSTIDVTFTFRKPFIFTVRDNCCSCTISTCTYRKWIVGTSKESSGPRNIFQNKKIKSITQFLHKRSHLILSGRVLTGRNC